MFSVYFFAFQIYCDFSGYTDIAIGVSLLFGLQLMENFRRPYLSRSTAEFWGERWHISLGRWFRDYLYIPLGGSRAGPVRQYLNLMLVFIASGLWHAGLGYGVGWTFLVWGALNGAYQWAGVATRPFWRRVGERLPRMRQSVPLAVLRVLLTFHLIAITWVFFRARSLGDAWLILQKDRLEPRRDPVPAVALSVHRGALHGFAPDRAPGRRSRSSMSAARCSQRLAAAPVALRWGVYYLGIFALLILGRWQAREFIYMQF